MSRANNSRKKENAQKEILPKQTDFFPIGLAGGCGNTVFTVTKVENYQ